MSVIATFGNVPLFYMNTQPHYLVLCLCTLFKDGLSRNAWECVQHEG